MASPTDMGAIADWFEHRPINKASRTALAEKLRSRFDFVGIEWADQNGAEVRMLDYACGPGFLSRLFAPRVSSVTAIDAAQAMVDRYRARIGELGDIHEGTKVVVGDLLLDSVESPALAGREFFDFDLVAVGAALHHFPDPARAVEVLARRLKLGGVLYVQDLFHNGGQTGEEEKGPRGYTEEEMRAMMDGAGLGDFKFESLPGETEIELLSEEVVRVKLFVTRARKEG
ncbi:S-adenosyl-L-methionine-dependent methyltransferase [Phaeosphaeria sp. MPI-PUGE-AT-0046c]|nr:S-adenosyl-L-methionine-dependent methyltransferase [Phaeosphaeria sp. MPI-PUGE-AT-0046c]